MDDEVKRFLKEAFVFAGFTLLLLGTLDFIYSSYVLPKHVLEKKEASYKDYLASVNGREIKYAFFGDSHFMNAIDPEYINDSFNFAVGGENYVKTYYRLKQVIQGDKVRVDNLVLEIDLHTFSTINTDETRLMYELWFYDQFVPYHEMSRITGKSLVDVIVRANIPIIGQRENLLSNVAQIARGAEMIPPLKRGWYCDNKNFAEEADRRGKSLVKVDSHFKNQKRISQIGLEYFEKTLRLANENGIKVVLVRSPVSKYYDEAAIARNITREDYYKAIFEVAGGVGGEYNILDYYSLYFNNTEYFSDEDHLNCLGSMEFSKLLAHDLESLK